VDRVEGVTPQEVQGQLKSELEPFAAEAEALVGVLPPAEAMATAETLSALYNCLGDLARYSQQHLTVGQQADWAGARRFYMLALRKSPGSGKAHNQLAVLATKEKQAMEATYQYTRAIVATHPFPARENLLLLYERHRQGSLSYDGEAGRGASMGTLQLRWLQLQGALDTRISMDLFEGLLAGYIDAFQTALDLGQLSEEFLVRLLVMGLYCLERGGDVEKVRGGSSELEGGENGAESMTKPGWGRVGEPPPVLEREQVTTVTFHACMLLFEMFGLVVRLTAADLKKLRFLQAVSMLCYWLRFHAPLANLSDERCEYFRSGLAQLVNGLMFAKPEVGQAMEGEPVLGGLRGFQPLERLPKWSTLQVSTVDLEWHLENIREARALLVYHADTKRYSAFMTTKQAIEEAERLELLQLIDARRAKAVESLEGKNKKKKKKKKIDGEEKPEQGHSVVEVAEAMAELTFDLETCGAEDFGEVVDSDGKEVAVDEGSEDSSTGPNTQGDVGEGGGDGGDGAASAINLGARGVLKVEGLKLGESSEEKSDEGEEESEEEAPQRSLGDHKPLIVLDAPNIAMRHGNHTLFSTKGIQIAIEFYRKRG
jgi:hypothetical protein